VNASIPSKTVLVVAACIVCVPGAASDAEAGDKKPPHIAAVLVRDLDVSRDIPPEAWGITGINLSEKKGLFSEALGHRTFIAAVALSPDGSLLAASSASAIRLWDMKKRQQVGGKMCGHTHLRHDDEKKPVRSSEFYYQHNPDRWKVETQSDLLWLLESEKKSLIPAKPKPGDRHEVAQSIQKRFSSTIGIDYLEGSVSALPTRKSTMSLIVDKMNDQALVLRLEGHAHLGKEFDSKLRTEPRSRGCALRLLGTVHYDRRKQAITRFDVVGVGYAWGRRTNEIRLDQYPWMYGIACELVTGDAPQDLIPPYNLLHYNPTGPYFAR